MAMNEEKITSELYYSHFYIKIEHTELFYTFIFLTRSKMHDIFHLASRELDD